MICRCRNPRRLHLTLPRTLQKEADLHFLEGKEDHPSVEEEEDRLVVQPTRVHLHLRLSPQGKADLLCAESVGR